MDLVPGLPTTHDGNDCILTFVDRFSKFVIFVPCDSHVSSEKLASLFIAHVVSKHGMPSKVISDRGP